MWQSQSSRQSPSPAHIKFPRPGDTARGNATQPDEAKPSKQIKASIRPTRARGARKLSQRDGVQRLVHGGSGARAGGTVPAAPAPGAAAGERGRRPARSVPAPSAGARAPWGLPLRLFLPAAAGVRPRRRVGGTGARRGAIHLPEVSVGHLVVLILLLVDVLVGGRLIADKEQ